MKFVFILYLFLLWGTFYSFKDYEIPKDKILIKNNLVVEEEESLMSFMEELNKGE